MRVGLQSAINFRSSINSKYAELNLSDKTSTMNRKFMGPNINLQDSIEE